MQVSTKTRNNNKMKILNVSGVYCIKNLVTGGMYIGSSKTVRYRWSQHLSTLRRGIHRNPKLQEAFNLYGEENFTIEILEEADEDQLLEVERVQIAEHCSIKEVYNIQPIGIAEGREASDGNRNKITAVRLEPWEKEKLERMAKAQHKPIIQVIREALQLYSSTYNIK